MSPSPDDRESSPGRPAVARCADCGTTTSAAETLCPACGSVLGPTTPEPGPQAAASARDPASGSAASRPRSDRPRSDDAWRGVGQPTLPIVETDAGEDDDRDDDRYDRDGHGGHGGHGDDDDSRSGGAASAAGARRAGEFPPGTVLLDRYRIEARLGQGGMGTVYRAHDLRLDQVVALKFLSPELARDERCLATLMNEVRLARKVTHPTVCRVHDIGEVSGRPFLSMEYVDGEDLRTLLRRVGRLTGDKAHQIARQLCAGVFAAHEKGVIHRDLKPANVMIDGEGNVRITDFGVAAATSAIDRVALAGSPAYMAPELFDGAPPSLQTDVYSLGLVLYELYTGAQVHPANSLTALVRMHSRPIPPPSGIARELPAAIEHAILGCLARRPERRTRTAMAVLAQLPGGDPLAEALRAGTTPSPELIAAAGGGSRLTPRARGALLAVIALGLAAMFSIDGTVKPLRRMDLPLPPDVLRDRARELLSALDVDTRGVRAAHGFEARRGADAARDLSYVYRQAPPGTSLAAHDLRGRVTWTDPAPDVPGMAQVRLAPDGGVLELLIVPAAQDAARGRAAPTGGAPPPPTDWGPVLAAAGLDPAALTVAPSDFVPRVFADARRSWTAPADDGAGGDPTSAGGDALPGPRGATVVAEGASLLGRPVAFRRPDALVSPAARSTSWRHAARIGLIGAALVLAWNSLRRRRGDLRGASRVGALVFSLVVAFTVLGGDHAGGWSGVAELASKGLQHGVAVGAMLALYYFAFEPYARLVWPQTIIGWERALTGRVSDPRVAQDALTGIALGVVAAFTVACESLAPALDGAPTRTIPFFSSSAPVVLEGLGPSLGVLLELAVDFSREAFKVFLSLIVLRLLLRSQLATFAAGTLIWTLVWAQPAPAGAGTFATMAPWLSAAAGGAAFSFAVVRFGLLTLVVSMFTFGVLLTFPLHLDLSHWNAEVTILAVALLFGAALAAAHHGGRRAFAFPNVEGVDPGDGASSSGIGERGHG